MIPSAYQGRATIVNLDTVMQFQAHLQRFAAAVRAVLRNPVSAAAGFTRLPERARGRQFSRRWAGTPDIPNESPGEEAELNNGDTNPIRAYFDAVQEGPGVWKWLHYFELYHRHLSKFIGRPVTVVEIGVYSGGSMPMWRHYFGPRCQVHGVDIQPECAAYSNEYTTIHVGDQADRKFWKRFREAVPSVDILIDDGGHLPEQQMITLEEMLPHLQAGGVYLCEDVHGIQNPFGEFVYALTDGLNAFVPREDRGILSARATPFQAAIHSVHFYPYAVVVEKRDSPTSRFAAPKHGTQWQPFL